MATCKYNNTNSIFGHLFRLLSRQQTIDRDNFLYTDQEEMETGILREHFTYESLKIKKRNYHAFINIKND